MLYLIVVQNGSGRGEIAGAAIVTTESADNLKWIAKTFRDTNYEACKKTQCIMTDKDLTERAAFKEIFPDAKFLLCLYHTLKTFDRKLKKLNLTRDERSNCFNLLRSLAYAKHKSRYDIVYKQFIDSAPKCVIDCFNLNWHPNYEEWTLFGMADVNYGNATNNLVESVNKQIKTLCDYNSSLSQFGINFFAMIKSSRQETNLLVAVNSLRQLNINHKLGNEINENSRFLTKTAFNILIKELQKYDDINIKEYCSSTKTCKMDINGYPYCSTIFNCVCYFRRSWKLPCVHILATRNYINLPLFSLELCDNI